MSRISTAFFGAAVLYALSGMLLGIFMGATQDFAMRPLHAHINLLGWAGLAIMGAFYGIAGVHAPRRLAWAVFALSNLGNLLALSMLYRITNNQPPIEPVLIAGEALIVTGMALFGVSVLMSHRKTASA